MADGDTDYRAIVHAMGDAVVACDKAGLITLWNRAATRIFGFDESEAIGQSLDIIIPERQRKRHWDGYHVTMETGITKYGASVLRVPAIDKSGARLSIAFTVAMVHSAAGEVTHIIAVIRDETARFAEEVELRKKLAELQAARSAP